MATTDKPYFKAKKLNHYTWVARWQKKREIKTIPTLGHRSTVRRKRWPYSKVLLGLLLGAVIAGNAASYALASQGLETAEGVTTSLNTVFGAAAVGYLLKSLGEHASMNAHGIEEIDGTDGDE